MRSVDDNRERRVPCPTCRTPALYGEGNPWHTDGDLYEGWISPMSNEIQPLLKSKEVKS